MSSANEKFVRPNGSVTDFFVVEAHVTSTRTADAYKALDKSRRQSIGLWMSRQPLPPAAVPDFAERMEKLCALGQIYPHAGGDSVCEKSSVGAILVRPGRHIGSLEVLYGLVVWCTADESKAFLGAV